MRISELLDTLRQDLRSNIRVMRKSPAFAGAVVAILALGIGANTIIFSVVSAVILNPLPYGEPGRLVRLYESPSGTDVRDAAVSAPNFKDWRSRQTVFEQLAAAEMATFNLTGTGVPERIASARITSNLLSTLGVAPMFGQGFTREEEENGQNHVALLSYGLWQRQFGGNRSLVGKTIELDDRSYTVVGIMPPEFQFMGSRDLWVPLVLDPSVEPWRADRSNRNLWVFGRLKPRVTLDHAQTEMEIVARNLEQQYPQTNKRWSVHLRTFYDWLVPEQVRRSLLVLFVTVGLLLLIACTNVANLMLARAGAREHEITIRAALGASRFALFRQLLVESLVLAALGGLAGVVLALFGTKLVSSINAQNVSRLSETRVDGQVLFFTIGVSVVTGLVFGLVPAWWASQLNPVETLKETDRRASGGLAHRLRGVLVVAEVALAVMLLIGAGLMMRSFARLQEVRLGFVPDNVLTAQISLPSSRYGNQGQRINFFYQLIEQLQTVPGVIDAGAATLAPSSGGDWAMGITVEGDQSTPGTARISAEANAVTPHYFTTMGIPLKEGRDFTDWDYSKRKLEMIVSQSFARICWPKEDPIGKHFRPGSNNPWGTVVGVVGDIRDANEPEANSSAFYFPYGYIGMPGMVVMIRTAGEPARFSSAIRAQVRTIDSEQPIYNLRTMSQIVSNATAQPRFQTLLLSLFGIAALLLATVGIYSVMAYLAGKRKHEIAVRMALGAHVGDVLIMVIRQGMWQILIGVGLGLAGSFALARLMKTLFFRVSATDPLTYAVVPVLVILIGFVACYVPARRATSLDPSTALREA